MFVSDILANKDKGHIVDAISQSDTVYEVLSSLDRNNIGALVVLSPSAQIEGIISERDVVRALHSSGAGALYSLVADLMKTDVTTCTEETSVEALMVIMTNQRIRHVPILRDGALVGLVSIGDVVKARLAELELDKRELLDYVSAR